MLPSLEASVSLLFAVEWKRVDVFLSSFPRTEGRFAGDKQSRAKLALAARFPAPASELRQSLWTPYQKQCLTVDWRTLLSRKTCDRAVRCMPGTVRTFDQIFICFLEVLFCLPRLLSRQDACDLDLLRRSKCRRTEWRGELILSDAREPCCCCSSRVTGAG